MKSIIKPNHLFLKQEDGNFHHVLEAPNPDGTTVQYYVTIICPQFLQYKEQIESIIATVFHYTIHPLVSKIYDLSQKQDTLVFHPELLVMAEAKDWSLSNMGFQLNHHKIRLHVIPKKAYIRYETTNQVKETSIVSFDKRYIDGSSICIKVDTHNPIDDKYNVTYKYVKTVEKSTNAILEGIEDIFTLHFKNMLF